MIPTLGRPAAAALSTDGSSPASPDLSVRANWPLPPEVSRRLALQALAVRKEAARIVDLVGTSTDPVARMDENLRGEIYGICRQLAQGQPLPGESDLDEDCDPQTVWSLHPPELCDRHRLRIEADQEQLQDVLHRLASNGESVLWNLRTELWARMESIQWRLTGVLAGCEPLLFSRIEAFTAQLDEAPAPTCVDELHIRTPHDQLRNFGRELSRLSDAVDDVHALLASPRAAVAAAAAAPLEATLEAIKLSLKQGKWKAFDTAVARFRQLRGPLIQTAVTGAPPRTASF